MEQQIGYCTTTDGVRIAYATYGNDDAPPLFYLPDIPNQEATWASPRGRAFFLELARHRRLITSDPRGYGASQRGTDSYRPDQVSDTLAVIDHLRIDRCELIAGGWVPSTRAILYSGAHPERVSKLVLCSPRVASSATVVATADTVRASYPIFLRSLATLFFPSGPPEVQRWFSTATRASVNAEVFAASIAWTYDLAPILPRLAAPVLIFHRKRSQVSDLTQARSVASLIPDARLVVLDGDAGALYWDYEQFIDTLYDFLGIGSESQAVALPSGTAVVLFTDIADSTALTERMGDAAFRALSRTIDDRVRTTVREHGGTPVEGKVLGDGVMGVFTSAAQAIAAARQCVALGQDLPMHIGLHAGDVTSEGTNIYGGAVNIASRICGLCAPGEILVSATVRDLARTSAGVTFEDRGEHALKGIAHPVRVFAVRGS
ncbi:MAG: adenylate/guanylate cyclase domain-containing protein [Dehalococcoidia bacterium]